MYKEAQKTKTQYTFEPEKIIMVTFSMDWNGRKYRKIDQISHLYDGRQSSSRRETGLETTLASIQASIKASIGLAASMSI